MAPHAGKYTYNTAYGQNPTAYEDSIAEEFSQFMPYIEYDENDPVLWIFGYGSLIWLPNVKFAASEDGYVKNYALRFWQGNTTHRGTTDSPGRVATLIPLSEAKTLGKAFQLKGYKQINEGLEHLCGREMKLGGYSFEALDFHSLRSIEQRKPIAAITFIATPNNKLYLGPAKVIDIALTIVNSRGSSGHNLEYLFRLTDSLRSIASDIFDPHLKNLESACHALLAAKFDSNDAYVSDCICKRRHHIAACKDSLLFDDFCNIDLN